MEAPHHQRRTPQPLAAGHHHRSGGRRTRPGNPGRSGLFTSVFDYIENFIDRSHHPRKTTSSFASCAGAAPRRAPSSTACRPNTRTVRKTSKPCASGSPDSAAGGEASGEFAEALRIYTHGLRNHIRSEERTSSRSPAKPWSPRTGPRSTGPFSTTTTPVRRKAKAEFRELFHRIASLAPDSIGLGAQRRRTATRRRPGAGPDAPQGERRRKLLRPHQGLERHRPRGQQGRTGRSGGANGAGKTTFLRTFPAFSR